MASRLNNQFLYSPNPQMIFIEGSFAVGGSSGAVAPSTAVLGRGVQSVTKKGVGQYVIQFSDNYNRLLDFQAVVLSPTSGALVTDGSLALGKPYQIVWPSTSTNWQTLGLPAGLTATYGMPFVSTSGASNGPLGSSGVTAAGNGTVIPIVPSGIGSIEVLPNPNTSLYPNLTATSASGTQGAYVFIQTLGQATSGVSGVTANQVGTVPTAPTSGSVIRFNTIFRNSSLVLNNELPTNY
jgi:hypothetical protein